MNKHQKNMLEIVDKQIDMTCTLVRLRQFVKDCGESNSVAMPIAESLSAQIEYLTKSQRVIIQRNIELLAHLQ